MKPLLNSKAVCQILDIKPATLSRMVHANKIPFVLLGAGKKKLTVRFREEELENWLTRRSRGPVPKAVSNLKPIDKNNGKAMKPTENKEGAPILETGVNTLPPLKDE